MLDLLKTLIVLSWPCGYEHSVSYFLKEYLEQRTDEIGVLGSVNT
jgi:tetrahedral aminopeptidase